MKRRSRRSIARCPCSPSWSGKRWPTGRPSSRCGHRGATFAAGWCSTWRPEPPERPGVRQRDILTSISRHLDRVESRHRLRLRVTTSTGCFFTVNVSQGGICTEQLRVPKVGTRMAGRISLDGRDALFDGRVAWVLTGDSRLNQLGRIGLRFERVGPGAGAGPRRPTIAVGRLRLSDRGNPRLGCDRECGPSMTRTSVNGWCPSRSARPLRPTGGRAGHDRHEMCSFLIQAIPGGASCR